MKTLIIDNYDSFTWNLFQYIGAFAGNPLVKTNTITLKEIEAIRPTHIVLSPGPGTVQNPKDFGVCHEVIQVYAKKIPILGVCLGHQGIISFFGGKITKAPKIMHGKTSTVHHNGGQLFHKVPTPFTAMRYHSLSGGEVTLTAGSAPILPKQFPPELQLTAWSEDGTIMGVQHCEYPLFGVQFHPESIGTPDGKQILSNFLMT